LRGINTGTASLTRGIKYDYYDYNLSSGRIDRQFLTTHTWTVAEAKAQFSELLDKAKSEGPQKITKHSRTTAVIVAAEQWEKNVQHKGTLAEFLAASPLPGSGLKLKPSVRLRDSA